MAGKLKHKDRSRSTYERDKYGRHWWFGNSGRWSSLVAGRRKAMKDAKS